MRKIYFILLILALIAGGLFYFKELRYTKVQDLVFDPPAEDETFLIKGALIELELDNLYRPYVGTTKPWAIDDGTGWAVFFGPVVPWFRIPPEGSTVVLLAVITNWDDNEVGYLASWRIITPLPLRSVPVRGIKIHEARWWE